MGLCTWFFWEFEHREEKLTTNLQSIKKKIKETDELLVSHLKLQKEGLDILKSEGHLQALAEIYQKVYGEQYRKVKNEEKSLASNFIQTIN